MTDESKDKKKRRTKPPSKETIKKVTEGVEEIDRILNSTQDSFTEYVDT